MSLVLGLWTFRTLLRGSTAIALENLALRDQLAVLQRSVRRPRLLWRDRILWVWLSRIWTAWRSSLIIVQPATVLGWHRRGVQLYWRWKSRAKAGGRPRLDPKLRHLIRQMARENPTWGRRRIQAELALLGYDVAELTVAKYMHRASLRPSGRRASWSRPFRRTTAPRDLLRDRDRIYGQAFSRRVERMGIHEVHIAPRAPWQNPFAERVIGSLRREGLDHFLILSEAHLRRLRRAYGAYDNTTWPHQSLENSSPQPGSSPFLRSEGSITATSVPPNHRDRDPPSLAPRVQQAW